MQGTPGVDHIGGVGEVGRHHADDVQTAVLDRGDGRADDPGIAARQLLPGTMGQHDGIGTLVDVLVRQGSPELRRDAEGREESGTDLGDPQLAGTIGCRQRQAAPDEVSRRVDVGHAVAGEVIGLRGRQSGG